MTTARIWDLDLRWRLLDAMAEEAKYLINFEQADPGNDIPHLRQLAQDLILLPLGAALMTDLPNGSDGTNTLERISIAVDYYDL